MINFKFMASWSDDDGDAISYTFIVSGVTFNEANESAMIRTNWFERHYLTVGMKFRGLVLISVDAREVL